MSGEFGWTAPSRISSNPVTEQMATHPFGELPLADPRVREPSHMDQLQASSDRRRQRDYRLCLRCRRKRRLLRRSLRSAVVCLGADAIIANGIVYVGTANSGVVAYGLPS
jgi:hypothetical protein